MLAAGSAPRLALLALALATAACTGGAQITRERAVMLVSRGQPAEAARELKSYIAEHPPAIAERKLLIRVDGVTGDLGAAEREAVELGKLLGAASPVPWIELGHAQELAHHYDRALALYDRAADVAPRDPAGPREGGLRAAHWGELEAAEPRLEEALRRDPRDASVWHALGVVRIHLNDLDGAEKAYRSGLQADPRALENHVGLATVALLRRDPAGALVQYDAIIAARPRFADARLGRSLALIELGRFDEAERALDAAQRLGANPESVERQRRLLKHLRGPSEVKQNR
jgi:tetratricopeptide (TPR) repeat protein